MFSRYLDTLGLVVRRDSPFAKTSMTTKLGFLAQTLNLRIMVQHGRKVGLRCPYGFHKTKRVPLTFGRFSETEQLRIWGGWCWCRVES